MTTTATTTANINLENVVRVRITDYSDYDSALSNNGGAYEYWTDYNRRPDGTWLVSYGTSADFDYCPVCGQFADHAERPEDCSPYWSGYTCGDYEFVSEAEVINEILRVQESDDYDVLYSKEWQNTGMDKQPIYRWNTFDCNDKSGDHDRYLVDSDDRSRTYGVTPWGVTIINLYDEPVEEDFVYYADEECSMLEDGFDRGVLIHAFIHDSEDVWTRGRADVYFKEVAENMIAMSERYNFGWVVEELWCEEEHSEFWRIYSREFAEKAYIGQNVSFCFREDALVEVMGMGGNNWSDFKKHEVIMMYQDGSYDKDEAYVVFHDKRNTLMPAQVRVLKSAISGLEKSMAAIDRIWNKRGVKDATAEPEWEKYENLVMLREELSHGLE